MTSPKNSAWNLEMTESAVREFKHLPRDAQQRIHNFLTKRLPQYDNPEDVSEPLVTPFQGKRRFRVGDYRIVFAMETESRTLYIQRIAHRSRVYS